MTTNEFIQEATSLGYNIRIGTDCDCKSWVYVFDGDKQVARFMMSAQLPEPARQYRDNPQDRERILVGLTFEYLNTPLNER